MPEYDASDPVHKRVRFVDARTEGGKVTLIWYRGAAASAAEPDDESPSFRILRREETAFTYGKDYDEFFLNRGPEGAAVVHDGPLAPACGAKWVFEDADVETHKVYSYYVQPTDCAPVGPAPVKIRDPRVCWDHAALMREARALAEDFADRVRLDVCGHTAAGREIPRLVVGAGGRALGLVGVIHAGEAGPELIVPALRLLLDESPEVFDDARVIAVPSVNLDGRERVARGVPWYLRTTPEGVDLNRNFPAWWEERSLGYGLDSCDPDSITYRGPRPASAPETRAVMAAFEDAPPFAVFSFHCLASICSLPALCYGGPGATGEYHLLCREYARLYASGLFPGERFNAKGFRPSVAATAGSLPAWLFKTFGCPAFDLEGGAVEEPDPWRLDMTDVECLRLHQRRHARAIADLLRTPVVDVADPA